MLATRPTIVRLATVVPPMASVTGTLARLAEVWIHGVFCVSEETVAGHLCTSVGTWYGGLIQDDRGRLLREVRLWKRQ
jgi:hypothetical protein